MLRVVAALLLSGCFAPEPITGAPCANGVPEGERCPSGQFCVMHDGVETCETEDVPDGVDRDGDLVIDIADNCPDLANTDQANEDLDDLGDLCDPCPPFDSNEDADNDGVGDACDPNPNTAGDKLLAFSGFTGPLPSTWTVTGQFLATAGEGLATADDNSSAIASVASPGTARVEIRTAARLISITATAPNLGAINVVERYLPQSDTGVACQLSALSTGEQQQLRIFDLDKKLVVDTAAHPIAAGTEVELRLRRSADGKYLCRATNPVLELAGDVAFAPPGARIGIRVRGAIAMFHWVMIITSP